jgi:hypothetical protein
MTDARSRKTDPASDAMETWHPGAALAAWILPGFGHYLLGERPRGAILGATILVLWTTGLLIGGVTVIDRIQNKPWFLGQMLLAPSVLVDAYHQASLKDGPAPQPGATDNRYSPSFGRVYEQGVLYTALAGLLNLLAIIDVVYRGPRRRGGGTAAAQEESP